MITDLKRIIFGRTTIPENWIFAGGDQNKAIPIVLSAFPNATVYVQKLEYGGTKKYIPQKTPVVVFDEHFPVTEGIRVVCSGGHCAGSCVVECSYRGKQYVLCGDECYGLYNIQNRVPTATSCNPGKSQAFIEKYVNSQYTCLLCHQKENGQI